MDIHDLSALLGENVHADTNADVWVVANSGAARARLVGLARHLADGLGCYVHALVSGMDDAPALIAFGADRVHVAADPVTYLVTHHPEFVLFADAQRDEAAGYAQRVGAGLITRAHTVRIEADSRALLASHPVYGSEYFHELAITSATKVAAVCVHELAEPHADHGRSGETIEAEVTPAPPPLHDLGPADYAPPAWRPLSKARVIVSAGRGVRDEAGFELVRQLAEKLGAELAGDRSALSSGWIDEAHEVGVTGQEVAPEIYLAIGILGDTYHNAAIAGARRVIAVHPQANAPIFQVADLAIMAEPKSWLPELLAALTATPPVA